MSESDRQAPSKRKLLTIKCRSLARQIISLTTAIKNLDIMEDTAKKMEDLVTTLRANAQKEHNIRRREERDQEVFIPLVVSPSFVEQPPCKKRRQRSQKKDVAKDSFSKSVQEGHGATEIIRNTGVDLVEVEVSSSERNEDSVRRQKEIIEVKLAGQAQPVATILPQQIDFGVKGQPQRIMVQGGTDDGLEAVLQIAREVNNRLTVHPVN